VYGNARVYGNAQVYGDARVYGDAWVSSVLYIQGSRHSLTTSSYSEIKIGCECHTVEYWLENFEKIGAQNNYTAQEIEEYGELIEFAARWLEKKGYRPCAK
jgi:carbonic anhydrase/acetyltransferase-like protein (isoleucine patch superfamily)